MKRIKAKLFTLLLTALTCILAGCAFTGCAFREQIPQSVINGSLGGKPLSLKLPKDADLTGLDVSAETNGAVRLHIDHLSVKMNPDVITQTGVAQSQIIKATADAVTAASSAAAAGAAAAFKASAGVP